MPANYEEDIKKFLGRVIKRYRILNDLKVFELAEKAELSETYVSEIERGAYNLSIKSLAKIAVSLNKAMWELLKEAEDEFERFVKTEEEGVEQVD